MGMKILCHTLHGFESDLVKVEADIRPGIPGMDIVGLPDNAVRESRERVRVSLRNSGFTYPDDRILVNLAPADLKKQGSGFDLPVALAVLEASGQLMCPCDHSILVCGELELSGAVRPVKGILTAIIAGLEAGIGIFLVPEKNFGEAKAVRRGQVYPIKHLSELDQCLSLINEGKSPPDDSSFSEKTVNRELDFSQIRGHFALKRVMELAAAGRHNLLLFGPPGTGKTMAAQRLVSILPDLSESQALEVTRIFSLAEIKVESLIQRPPFRNPHHSTSPEGMTGGGRVIRPGEVSLSHHGVLFLDEACEFRRGLLQSLREPLETGRITISRAGVSLFFPAQFQLVMAANLCPCGLTGSARGVCLCSEKEIDRYWKKIGGAILDRIELKFPVMPVDMEVSKDFKGPDSFSMAQNILRAWEIQYKRNGEGVHNSRIGAEKVFEICEMDSRAYGYYSEASRGLGLSSRGAVSVLKVARTAADLDNESLIGERHIREAIGYRKMENMIWNRRLWRPGSQVESGALMQLLGCQT